MSEKKPNDRPRDEIMQLAQDVIDRSKGSATVYFKWTCPECKTRCTFEEPNILYEEGECWSCKQTSKIETAGFMLTLDLEKRLRHGPKPGTSVD